VTLRLRPRGAKDWAEIAEREGLDAVRAQIEARLNDSPEEAAEPAAESAPVCDSEALTPDGWKCPF
jgi:hypothetical protein